MDLLNWLMAWYQCNCNGDWEHSFGVKISTLDNPGWVIRIDLKETALEDKTYLREEDNSDTDWYRIESDGRVFTAGGDPAKLELLLNAFKEFSGAHE